MNYDAVSSDLQSAAHLKRQLQRVRHDSLIATRRGDFATVSRLSNETAYLKRKIVELELPRSDIGQPSSKDVSITWLRSDFTSA